MDPNILKFVVALRCHAAYLGQQVPIFLPQRLHDARAILQPLRLRHLPVENRPLFSNLAFRVGCLQRPAKDAGGVVWVQMLDQSPDGQIEMIRRASDLRSGNCGEGHNGACANAG